MIITNEQEFINSEFCHGETPVINNSKIIFNGSNNRIICESGVCIKNSSITFVGSGNLVYLSSNYHSYCLDIRIYKNSVFYMDENNYLNGKLNVLCQEHQNILIGKEGAFSYGINFMTSDAHLIYDMESMKRINGSKSIFIGDHVWIGAYASVFKGTMIGSGSVIGGTSTITGKKVESNSVWAGNPAKKIKEGVFGEKECPNMYDIYETEDSNICKDTVSKYIKDKSTLCMHQLDKELIGLGDNITEKIKIINNIRSNNSKNRFFL